ncbi:g-box-binding factor 4 [Phtheirospermum japonicum]|uniref:G-box-binding factor 4 n=1 Tax=Phtheirospermum japonicum TaxID=374723 RepID=A0A830BNC7_9LAMI|nr:g-box-binding factor 4 [Phtheirospermum japonicum]
MASSKVMASRSPPNPDLPRQPSTSALNLHSGHSRSFESMNMDEILRNIYSDSDTFALENNVGEGGGGGGGGSAAADGGGDGGMRNANGNKTVDEVWREIVSGGGSAAAAAVGVNAEPGMTLEDFLAKAGAGNEEDVRVPTAVMTMTPAASVPAVSAFGMETVMMNPAAAAVHFAPSSVQNGFGVEFGNGMAAVSGGGGGGRGKRRAVVEEVPLDKATQQKQRRMIKNRESAARSRERKQAYTVELESLVTHLEEENARLLKEEVLNKLLYTQAELNKKRYEQVYFCCKLVCVVIDQCYCDSDGESNSSGGKAKTSKSFAESAFDGMVEVQF